MKDDTRVTTKATRSELVALVEALRLEVATLENTLRGSDGTRELLERIQDGILVIDADTHRIREANPMAATMFGAPRDKIMGHECFEFICPAQRGACPVTDLGVAVDHAERQMVTKGGGRKPILKTVARMTLGGDDVLVESFMDISELKKVERSLSEHVHLLQSVMDAVPAPVFYKDSDGRYRGCNGAFLQLMGRKQTEVIGRTVEELALEDLAKHDASRDLELLASPGTQVYEAEVRGADGNRRAVVFNKATYNDADGNLAGLVGVMLDITDLRRTADEREHAIQRLKKTRAELKRLSISDGLTGLANRRHLDDMLSREWRRAQRADLPLALLMADIDRFKAYNDALGHAAGDACLTAIADALTAQVHRPGDLVGRWGGEEFLAILPATDATGATCVAEAIRRGIQELDIAHPGLTARERTATGQSCVTITVGVAVARGDLYANADAAVGAADAALYRAKRAGRNKVVTT
jgi:diguanylate cyclase (GGDEF)-like protein/PAS domain S-box-containing protein